MATTKCSQCSHENEPERVYCHNCGTKLDRSVLVAEEKKETPETPDQMRKRVIKMANPARGPFNKLNVQTFFKMIAFGAVIAVVVQAAREPDHIPELLENKDLHEVPQIGDRLEDELANPESHQLAIPEKAANGYLQKTIKNKDASGKENGGYLKFERAFLHFDNGICNMNLKVALFGWPLYATSYYQLKMENEELHATTSGGAIGRMPVHPAVMKLKVADVIFANLWDALKREKKLLDQLKTVEIKLTEIDGKKQWAVVMTTFPGKAGAPGR